MLLSLLPLQSEHTNATEDEGLQLTVELGTSRLVEVPVPCGVEISLACLHTRKHAHTLTHTSYIYTCTHTRTHMSTPERTGERRVAQVSRHEGMSLPLEVHSFQHPDLSQLSIRARGNTCAKDVSVYITSFLPVTAHPTYYHWDTIGKLHPLTSPTS